MYKFKWPMKFPSRIKKPLSNTRLSKIRLGKSFYLVVVLCIAAIAVTSVWTFKQSREYTEQLPSEQKQESIKQKNEDKALLEINPEEHTPEKNVPEEKKTAEIPKTETKEQKQAEPKYPEPELKPVSSQVNLNTMIQPVLGKVYTEHFINKLTYSKTLEQWQVHPGIDILADEGSAVKAVLPGVVEEIRIDPKLGVMVIIDHGNEIKTKYANLAAQPPVTPGLHVEKGSIIGKTGRTAVFESEDPPHLHFEVIQKGNSIDPNLYLPKIQ